MKIIVAITGASGVSLGLKFINFLNKEIEVFLIISDGAKKTLKLEQNETLSLPNNVTIFNDNFLEASISSGSFYTDSMIILPCSMNTLAKCTIGISDTLITRSFSVCLKEKRKIVIAPREMPYNTIQLENMTKLSQLGVIVAPPSLAYYSDQTTLEDMEKFMIGKWCDMLDIKNTLYKRWNKSTKDNNEK